MLMSVFRDATWRRGFFRNFLSPFRHNLSQKVLRKMLCQLQRAFQRRFLAAQQRNLHFAPLRPLQVFADRDKERLRRAVLSVPKRLLGLRRYEKLRRGMLGETQGQQVTHES